MREPLYTDLKTPSYPSYDIEAINNSIRNILTTSKGSLEGMPEFGSRLNELVFSQIDHITVDLLKNLIKEALDKWEDRIILLFHLSLNITDWLLQFLIVWKMIF